jgi:hypothetical protein
VFHSICVQASVNKRRRDFSRKTFSLRRNSKMNTFSTDSAAPVIEHPPSQCCVALCRCLQRINRRHGTSNPANKLAPDLSFQKACLDRVDAGIAVEKLRGPLSGWQATPRRRAHADVDAVLIDFLSIADKGTPRCCCSRHVHLVLPRWHETPVSSMAPGPHARFST